MWYLDISLILLSVKGMYFFTIGQLGKKQG